MSTLTVRRVRKSHPSSSEWGLREHTGSSHISVLGEGVTDVPLLMLNGVGAEYRIWKDLRRSIGRPTLAFDVQSRHLGRRPSIRTFAKYVRDMLDERQIQQVDVLGLSWGGFAAQQLAHDHPTRVRRLVLASTSPGYYSVPARPSSYVALLRPSRTSKRAATLSKHLYAGDFLRDPSLIHQLGLIRPIDGSTYHRQLWATIGWSSLPWLHSIRQETLILHGGDDPVIPFVNARLMHRLLPNARLHRVENGGHLYLYTRPKLLGPKIGEFLSAANP